MIIRGKCRSKLGSIIKSAKGTKQNDSRQIIGGTEPRKRPSTFNESRYAVKRLRNP